MNEKLLHAMRCDEKLSERLLGIMSDKDILTNLLGIPEDEANKIISNKRMEILYDLKLEIIRDNPGLGSIMVPVPESEKGTFEEQMDRLKKLKTEEKENFGFKRSDPAKDHERLRDIVFGPMKSAIYGGKNGL